MEININQARISFGDKYKIYTGGDLTHRGIQKLWRWLAEIQLVAIDREEPRYVLKRRWAWFAASYDLRRFDGAVYEYRTQSVWKRHYSCLVGKDLYEIYGHRGRKFSIFKNDRQIGFWEKARVTWFNGDNYKLTADNDADAELLMSFVLVADNYSSSDKKNDKALNFNFYIGSQARKFDKEWQPR